LCRCTDTLSYNAELTYRSDYSFSDLQKFRTGITRDDKLTEQRKASQRDEVTKMYNFCENASICRRVQILEYFGQKDFDPRQCNKMCDNCQSTELAEEHDVTDCARKTISLLREITSARDFKLARGYLEVLLRGSKRKDVMDNNHHLSEYHGCCSHMSKDLLELFVNRLCAEEIISIYSVANGSRYHNDYLQVCGTSKFALRGLHYHFRSAQRPLAYSVLPLVL